MKLTCRVTLRLAPTLALVMAAWAAFFYFAMLSEVNDETDDSLEDYSEIIIRRVLAGEPCPALASATNNQHYLRTVSEEYAATRERIRYADRDVYIPEKKEYEPARVLTTIFRADDGRMMELTVSLPTIEKEDLQRAIWWWVVCLYVALLLAVLSVNLAVFSRSMRPLHRLLAWLDSYRLGGPGNKPLDSDTGVTEFARLNAAVMQQAARNEKMYEQQKQFIANASHELQTPLAICCNRIEMLLEDESLTEGQIGELVKIRGKLEGMSRLNRSLLLLCRIDSGQAGGVKRVSFNAILGGCLGDFEEAYAPLGVRAGVEERGTFAADMNETLAATLVTNLLKNSFAHNVRGGRVRVDISQDAFTIRNTGAAEALDTRKIFTRFYHSGAKPGSTGLGLPIAQAICRLYGLALEYRYEGGMHVFEIRK